MTRIAVIIGSTREGRFADIPARWAVAELAKVDGIEVDLVDLRDHPLPEYDIPTPARTPRKYSTEAIGAFASHIDSADGFIILTPEYNHGYTAALKNAMDHLFVEWTRKPVAFIAWGSVGGARAVEQLRQVAAEFEMAPLRHAVHILPDVMRPAMMAQDRLDPALLESLKPRFDIMVNDLKWWADALSVARAQTS
ncbi:MAG: NAD(P)H-dependent oxidoreductase [Actinomycetota bacterium]|nr:NAD(P)H-dependent oxidoreductase [Actinomycetota bacterium]